MKNSLPLILSIILSGCSKAPIEGPYCKAIASDVTTRNLAVRGIYIYGTLEHGAILISPSCLRPIFGFYSFQNYVSPEEGTSYRIRQFNKIVYNTPRKKSGMFEIEAAINVYPKSRIAELYDIRHFREISDSEAEPIINMLHQSRD